MAKTPFAYINRAVMAAVIGIAGMFVRLARIIHDGSSRNRPPKREM